MLKTFIHFFYQEEYMKNTVDRILEILDAAIPFTRRNLIQFFYETDGEEKGNHSHRFNKTRERE